MHWIISGISIFFPTGLCVSFLSPVLCCLHYHSSIVCLETRNIDTATFIIYLFLLPIIYSSIFSHPYKSQNSDFHHLLLGTRHTACFYVVMGEAEYQNILQSYWNFWLQDRAPSRKEATPCWHAQKSRVNEQILSHWWVTRRVWETFFWCRWADVISKKVLGLCSYICDLCAALNFFSNSLEVFWLVEARGQQMQVYGPNIAPHCCLPAGKDGFYIFKWLEKIKE